MKGSGLYEDPKVTCVKVCLCLWTNMQTVREPHFTIQAHAYFSR